MFSEFLKVLDDPEAALSKDGTALKYKGVKIPVRNGIPRFTPDESYSSGNFARLREEHAILQMDSQNGTTDRRDTILDRTNWPADFWKGKLVLECGCGAGPDTEIMRNFGAKVVAVDIAGVDVAKDNLSADGEGKAQFVQASIMDLPFKPESFDIVFCHRVLQHTPDPEHVLAHILSFVKPDGAVFVHSYARTWIQMCRWKYVLLPFTRKINSEKLYNFVKWYAPFAYKVTGALRRIPGGRVINHFCIPFLNYRHAKQFKPLSDERVLEIGVHDTFDALSPPYDEPVAAATMRAIAAPILKKPFEIIERPMVTLLRTIVSS
ncbi:MAG: class I SAM-dependent methyltransferase [Pseudobdellovibrionaceae bacterium]